MGCDIHIYAEVKRKDLDYWLASKHPKIWDILCDEYVAYLSKQKSKGEEKKGERGTRGKRSA